MSKYGYLVPGGENQESERDDDARPISSTERDDNARADAEISSIIQLLVCAQA